MPAASPNLQRFVVYAPDATDEGALARRASVRERHLAGIKPLEKSGFLQLGGAMFTPESFDGPPAEKKMIGSVLICEAENLGEVKKYIESDIYYTAGVWDKEKVVILPFVAATWPST